MSAEDGPTKWCKGQSAMHIATVKDAEFACFFLRSCSIINEASLATRAKSTMRRGTRLRICKLIYPPRLCMRQDTIEWTSSRRL